MSSQLLSVSVSEQLKNFIVTGQFPPGMQIPNEQELIDKLNVSRSTIREAIKLLVSQNVLEIKRGKGTFVSMVPGLCDDPFGFAFLPSNKLLTDLMELRTVLEPHVGAMAAVRATPKQVKKLYNIAEEMDETFTKITDGIDPDHNMDNMAQLDSEFHILVYQMTQNAIFERLIPVVNKVITAYYTSERFRNFYKKYHKKTTHHAICEAIKIHDADTTADLCRRHMISASKIVSGAIVEEIETIC